MTSEGEPQGGGGCQSAECAARCSAARAAAAGGMPNPEQMRSVINNIDIEALKKMKIMQAMQESVFFLKIDYFGFEVFFA